MKVKSTILLARIVLVIAFYPFGIKYIDFPVYLKYIDFSFIKFYGIKVTLLNPFAS